MRGVPVSRLYPDSGYARCSVAVIGGVARDAQRVDYQRCSVYFDAKRGSLVALSTGSQQSSRLMSAANANALLVLQPGDKHVQHGETVDALLIERVKAIDASELSSLVSQSMHGRQQQTSSVMHDHHHHYRHHSHGHGHSHNCQPHSSDRPEAASVGDAVASPVTITVAVVTVSDRAASGHAQDSSGPAIEQLLHQYSIQRPQSETHHSPRHVWMGDDSATSQPAHARVRSLLLTGLV